MENQIGKVFAFKDDLITESLRNRLGIIANHWITESGIHWYDAICFDGTRVVDVRSEQIDILANNLNEFSNISE